MKIRALALMGIIALYVSACGTTTLPAATTVSTAVPVDTSTPWAWATALPTETSVPQSSATAGAPVAPPRPDTDPTRDPTAVFEEFKGGHPYGSLLTPTNAAAATQAVQQYNQLLTRTALTPTEPPPPTLPPQPTPTHGVGLITDSFCIRALHGGFPRFPSCWEARVNNQWVLVGGGQTEASGESLAQSMILICPGPCFDPDEGTIYLTPRNVQEVRIAHVTGTLVTVVPRDPARPDVFLFDLATNQWVTPPGATPYPVLATPPLHTPTPVPAP